MARSKALIRLAGRQTTSARRLSRVARARNADASARASSDMEIGDGSLIVFSRPF